MKNKVLERQNTLDKKEMELIKAKERLNELEKEMIKFRE